MLLNQSRTIQPEGGPESGRRRQHKGPDRQLDGNPKLNGLSLSHTRGAGVFSWRGRIGNKHFHPQRLIAVTTNGERKCIPLLIRIAVDAWDQRIGPQAHTAFDGRRMRDIEKLFQVDSDMVSGDLGSILGPKVRELYVQSRNVL